MMRYDSIDSPRLISMMMMMMMMMMIMMMMMMMMYQNKGSPNLLKLLHSYKTSQIYFGILGFIFHFF